MQVFSNWLSAMRDSTAIHREAHFSFSESPETGLLINVCKTHDGARVETQCCWGKPYKDRNIVSVTTQLGCPVGCAHCIVHTVPLFRNLKPAEMVDQVEILLDSGSSTEGFDRGRPLKISLNRAGEPLLNPHIPDTMELMARRFPGASFQIFSVFPDGPLTTRVVNEIMAFAEGYDRPVQVVVSLHESDEAKRRSLMPFAGGLMPHTRIAEFAKIWSRRVKRRKFSLSFALPDHGMSWDILALREAFPPRYFVVRVARFLPSDQDTAERFGAAADSRLEALEEAAHRAGYEVVYSPAQPLEETWDIRPYSAWHMLRAGPAAVRPDGRTSAASGKH